MPNENARVPEFVEDARGWNLSGVDDRAEVLIGEKNGRPFVRSEKWNNPHPRFPGCWLELAPKGVEVSQSNRPIVIPGQRQTLRMECGRNGKTEHHEFKPGSVEYDIVLTTKDQLPAETREDCFVFRFDATHPAGLSWYHQPQEVEEEGAERPDNVKDSFALYFGRAGRFTSPDGAELVNYENGKYAHCYRTKIILPGGEVYWGRLWKEDGELLVGVPFEAVNAWNPSMGELRVDPTFGYTSIGGSTFASSLPICLVGTGETHVATTGDTVTSLSVYARSTTSSTARELGVYNISGSVPQSLTGAGSVTITTTAQWHNSATVSVSLSNGVTYGPAFSAIGTTINHYYDSSSGTNRSTHTSSNAFLPNTWSEGSSASSKWSTYATYIVAATGTLLKHPGMNGGMNRNMNAGMRG